MRRAEAAATTTDLIPRLASVGNASTTQSSHPGSSDEHFRSKPVDAGDRERGWRGKERAGGRRGRVMGKIRKVRLGQAKGKE